MKTVLTILVLSCCALAQDSASASAQAPGCGPESAKFEVKIDKQQHPVMQPASGKALVYFIEDDSSFGSTPKPTTMMGLDGAWVGATHGNSYFYLPLEPGEHHLCARWQTTVILGAGRKAAAFHFTAEAGNAYYFRVQNSWSRDTTAAIAFAPVDSDEAQLLMSKYSLSTSHPK